MGRRLRLLIRLAAALLPQAPLHLAPPVQRHPPLSELLNRRHQRSRHPPLVLRRLRAVAEGFPLASRSRNSRVADLGLDSRRPLEVLLRRPLALLHRHHHRLPLGLLLRPLLHVLLYMQLLQLLRQRLVRLLLQLLRHFAGSGAVAAKG